VGTPGMNSITKHMAKLPGVTLMLSRRVTGFEVGPLTVCSKCTGVHGGGGPAARPLLFALSLHVYTADVSSVHRHTGKF